VQGIGISVLDLERAHSASIRATISGAQTASTADGVKSVVFGCTGMLGYSEPTAKALGWPTECVIDPLLNAIETAFQAVQAGEKTNKDKHPFPDRKLVAGFERWSALDDLMRIG